MYKIVVLMSTYNGEKYLEEQIESIINQTIKAKIIVRDDGSKDKTQMILDKYKKRGYLEWYQGKNIGFMRSFLTLIKKAPVAEYYAFADQDDYWEKNKLEEAIKKLEKEKKACLYCSNLALVDENLNKIPYNYNNKKVNISFESILWRNISAGCTMVFNNNLRKYIDMYEPKNIKYHDWWICLLAISLGKVIYDKNSYIKYRQHSSNVIGCKNNIKRNYSWLKSKFKNDINWNFGRPYQQELLIGYKDKLEQNKVKLLTDMLTFDHNYEARYRIIFNKNFVVNDLKGTIYRKLLVFLGKN